jgi:hypothetical protein
VSVAPGPDERLFLGLVEHAPGESIDFCLLGIASLVIGPAPPPS